MNWHETIFGESQHPSKQEPQRGPADSSKPLQKQSSILIVEDELLVAENIKELLNSAGYAISGIFVSGEDAIDHFQELNPDLILMDIRLAGSIDGIRTAQIIHQQLKIVPILFLTAYGEELIPDLAVFEPHSFDLLTKPYDKVQIIKSISDLLSREKHNPH